MKSCASAKTVPGIPTISGIYLALSGKLKAISDIVANTANMMSAVNTDPFKKILNGILSLLQFLVARSPEVNSEADYDQSH